MLSSILAIVFALKSRSKFRQRFNSIIFVQRVKAFVQRVEIFHQRVKTI